MAQPLPQALRPLYLKVQAILQVSFPCLAGCRTPLWRMHHCPKMIMIGNGALLKIPDNLVGRKQVIDFGLLASGTHPSKGADVRELLFSLPT